MTRDEIASMFERRQAQLSNHNVEAVLGYYADDCIVESPIAGRHVGKKAIEEAMRAILTALDVKFDQHSFVIDGNMVAMAFYMEGKDVGHLLGLAPTGKSFRVPAVFLYELKNGLIVHERRVYDFTGLLVQIGLLTAKPARPQN